MATMKGFEPSASSVTGWRSSLLSYIAIGATDGNRTHIICLEGRGPTIKRRLHGGDKGI